MASTSRPKAGSGLVVASLDDLGIADLREVGRGATSTVYAGDQERYAREVAVKVYASPLTDDKAKRRFDRECKTLGRLSSHPNVVNLFGSGFDSHDRPFIVMDFCQGGSLHDRLAQQGPMPVAEVLRVGVKIASALEFAHRSRVLHRDIKPGNILVTSFGEPVLSDFGIAGGVETGLSWTIGDALTPLFAAPEVLETGGGTPASDIWSLSATLWALLVGHAPFADTASGLLTLVNRIINDPLPDLERDDVPAAVKDLLVAGMAKSQSERPASAEAFAHELQAIQRDLGAAVTEYVDPAAPVTVPTQMKAGPISGRTPRRTAQDATGRKPETNATSLRPGSAPRSTGDNQPSSQSVRGKKRLSVPRRKHTTDSPPKKAAVRDEPAGEASAAPAPAAAETASATVLRRQARQVAPTAEAPDTARANGRRIIVVAAAVVSIAAVGGIIAASSGNSARPQPASASTTQPAAVKLPKPVVNPHCRGRTCRIVVSVPSLSHAATAFVSYDGSQATGHQVQASHPKLTLKHSFALNQHHKIAVSVVGAGGGSSVAPPVPVFLRSWTRTARLTPTRTTSHHLRLHVAANGHGQCRAGRYQLEKHVPGRWVSLGKTRSLNPRGSTPVTEPVGVYRAIILTSNVADGRCGRFSTPSARILAKHVVSGSGSSSTTSTQPSSSTSTPTTGTGGASGGGGLPPVTHSDPPR